MTLEMILSLGILILMIVMIMSDKFSFGAPPIVACLLLVLTGLSTVEEAFAGFINSSVVMIAGFMIVMAGLLKTSLMGRIQTTMINLVNKGGYKSYALLLVVVMLGASLVGTGATGYYVLILSLVTTFPYTKKLPPSKLVLPLGIATNHPLVPVNVALQYGITVGLLKTAGYMDTLSMSRFAIVNLILSLGFLAWSLVAYRLLPDHPIAEISENEETTEKAVKMPIWKEYCTIGAFAVSVIGMMLMNMLGEVAYVVPGIAGGFLALINVLDFKEVRDNMCSPIILMTAGVIGVADALDNSGFTNLIGNSVASLVGNNLHPFLLIFIFALLTSTVATFTGSNMGPVFIFAPIAIAASVKLGLNPAAAATAVVISGWNGHYMPIDGLPAMTFGMGRYKLPEFWLYTVPMYFIRIFALSVGAYLMFPIQ